MWKLKNYPSSCFFSTLSVAFGVKKNTQFRPDCGQNTYFIVQMEHSSHARVQFSSAPMVMCYSWDVSESSESIRLSGCKRASSTSPLPVFRGQHHPLGGERFFILRFRRSHCNTDKIKINIHLLPRCYAELSFTETASHL